MKPILEDISNSLKETSFYAFSYSTKAFDFKWHFHPEYELTFIVKGNGNRLIGNSNQEFCENDFVLIGPNLPHTWFGKSANNEEFEAIVIQMPIDFIERIIDFKEFNPIKTLFQQSNFGIFFTEHPSNIKELLINVLNCSGIEKIIALFNVLSLISRGNYVPISSTINKYQINEETESRINKVCIFLQNNFSKKISLKEVADLIYMTESNFCKFFKKTTTITFSNYLNDLRINAVCKLLLVSEENINNIAYSCGFDSLSYFNRVFLNKKQISPRAYRMNHKVK
jgi:AraC-like DNA-binding protein/mannose-6-phosphate isomerase-like protein (cupin superfamily)